MPSPKEKPKGAKTKKGGGKAAARSQPAISAKQAAKLLKDKYVRQLDQRQPESGSAEVQAVDQVEGAGSWAVDELLTHERPRSDRRPDQRTKERPRDVPGTPAPADAPAPADTPASVPESANPPHRQANTSPRQRPGPTPKEKVAQVKGTHPQRTATPAEPSASPANAGPADASARTMRIKERPAVRLKEQRARAAAPSIKEKPSSLANQSIPSIKSTQSIPSAQKSPAPPTAGRSTTPAASQPGFRPASPQPRREVKRQMINRSRHSFSRQPEGAGLRKTPGAAPSARNTGRNVLPRKGTASKSSAPKIRGAAYRKGVSGPKAGRAPIKSAVSRPVRGIRQNAQRRMTQRTVQQAGKAAKTSAVILKKAAVAVTKAASALVSALAGIVGGGILLLALVVVVVIAAIANSPFGLFFAQEPNAPGTVSVAQAVGTVNMAYNSRLELLQTGDYDTITLDGQAPDWADVLAVFAVKTAGADVDGLDVATLDPDRVNRLTAVFWDMTGIAVSEETIDHPASGSTAAWSEKILHITITPRTADDMRVSYAFSEHQNSALDELLSDRAALTSLAGSLAITSADVREVLDALPDDLDPARREAVQTALQLVGKVNYFWGGKSYVIGWDPRWGQLAKVWSAGNSTTGTYRPFGLDCSGFIDWALRNAGLHSDGHWYIGTNLTAVSQTDALPGDLALYPDASHVGMVVGRNGAGKLLVCHCSSGQNNVVVTEFTASGFTVVGRPGIYST